MAREGQLERRIYTGLIELLNLLKLSNRLIYGFFKRPLYIHERKKKVVAHAYHFIIDIPGRAHCYRRGLGSSAFHLYTFLNHS